MSPSRGWWVGAGVVLTPVVLVGVLAAIELTKPEMSSSLPVTTSTTAPMVSTTTTTMTTTTTPMAPVPTATLPSLPPLPPTPPEDRIEIGDCVNVRHEGGLDAVIEEIPCDLRDVEVWRVLGMGFAISKTCEGLAVTHTYHMTEYGVLYCLQQISG
ncbi:hypothetical protein JNUCC0626_16520 [Lentzea sp. JNUCC 0626]|uniref:hypothetical protein n=1 Tax=Lentzea sp. JNUCC 0626 TaxID=3367513 RepID=UPI003749D404